jgi:16S rRNA (guanine1207-N2)-methyltransferase
MRAALELLARYRSRQAALFLAAEEHPHLQPLAVYQPLKNLRQQLSAPDWDGQASFEEIHLLATPSRQETEEYLHWAARALSPSGFLYLAVENDLGADGWRKRLRPLECESGMHSRLLKLRPEPGPGNPSQLRPLHDFVSCPGLFSWDRLDAGSALLLEHLPRLRGQGADFGCGPGLLARAYLRSLPDTQSLSLDLIDVDQRAVAAAEQNCPGSRAFWLDLSCEPAPQKYDFILLNPPFHRQGREQRTLGQKLVERAVAHLHPGGQLFLVANSHLDYRRELAPLETRQLFEGRGFRITLSIR